MGLARWDYEIASQEHMDVGIKRPNRIDRRGTPGEVGDCNSTINRTRMQERGREGGREGVEF